VQPSQSLDFHPLPRRNVTKMSHFKSVQGVPMLGRS
jgi:hypothetical protein